MEAINILLPLLADLVLGFMVRLWSRRAHWSVFTCLIIPPAVAMVAPAPRALFAEGGEAQYWATLMFIFWVLFGFAACVTGVLLGYLLRQRRDSTPRT